TYLRLVAAISRRHAPGPEGTGARPGAQHGLRLRRLDDLAQNPIASAGARLLRVAFAARAMPGSHAAIVARSASVVQRSCLPPARTAAPSSARNFCRRIVRKPMSRMVGVGHLPSLSR